jgi:hypothetical protein
MLNTAHHTYRSQVAFQQRLARVIQPLCKLGSHRLHHSDDKPTASHRMSLGGNEHEAARTVLQRQ